MVKSSYCVIAACKHILSEEQEKISDRKQYEYPCVEASPDKISADDYCIECSTDGVNFSQMRICHMYAGADEISFGIYACSPEESSFTAVFSDMKITECMWKAHDGQQPDE